MVLNVSTNNRRLSWLILPMISSRAFGCREVVVLGLQRLGAILQLGQFLKRIEVDAAQAAQLAAEFGDLVVGGVDIERTENRERRTEDGSRRFCGRHSVLRS